MNPVFWFLVVLGLFFAWWSLWPFFKRIGGSATDAVDTIKKEISDEDEGEK